MSEKINILNTAFTLVHIFMIRYTHSMLCVEQKLYNIYIAHYHFEEISSPMHCINFIC